MGRPREIDNVGGKIREWIKMFRDPDSLIKAPTFTSRQHLTPEYLQMMNLVEKAAAELAESVSIAGALHRSKSRLEAYDAQLIALFEEINSVVEKSWDELSIAERLEIAKNAPRFPAKVVRIDSKTEEQNVET